MLGKVIILTTPILQALKICVMALEQLVVRTVILKTIQKLTLSCEEPHEIICSDSVHM